MRKLLYIPLIVLISSCAITGKPYQIYVKELPPVKPEKVRIIVFRPINPPVTELSSARLIINDIKYNPIDYGKFEVYDVEPGIYNIQVDAPLRPGKCSIAIASKGGGELYVRIYERRKSTFEAISSVVSGVIPSNPSQKVADIALNTINQMGSVDCSGPFIAESISKDGADPMLKRLKR